MEKETLYLIGFFAVMVIVFILLIVQVHKLNIEFIELTEMQKETLEDVHEKSKNIQRNIERIQKRKGYTQKIYKQKTKQMHYKLLNS